MPSRPGAPNTSSVLGFGVAVKAKKLRFVCWPRLRIALRISSSCPAASSSACVRSASLASSSPASTALQLVGRLAGLRAVRLVDDRRRSRRSGRLADLAPVDERELLERGDDDRHARSRAPRQAAREFSSIFCDDAVLVLELVDRVLELLVEHAPVGDDDHRVEDLAGRRRRAGWRSRCASQAMVLLLPLPAECWIR